MKEKRLRKFSDRDFAPIPDPQDADNEAVIQDVVDDAPVVDAVLPIIACQLGAGQCFADLVRMVQRGERPDHPHPHPLPPAGEGVSRSAYP